MVHIPFWVAERLKSTLPVIKKWIVPLDHQGISSLVGYSNRIVQRLKLGFLWRLLWASDLEVVYVYLLVRVQHQIPRLRELAWPHGKNPFQVALLDAYV